MAKESGLGWTLCDIDDAAGTPRQLRNDITNLDIATPRGVQDITGLDRSARETLLLLADASLTFNGPFNPAANQSHQVFRTISSTEVPRTITNTISSQTLVTECILTDYNLVRATGGDFTYTVPAVLQNGTAPTWT